MKIALYNIDRNLNGFYGEIEVQKNIIALIKVCQPYEVISGDYETPDQHINGNIQIEIERVYYNTDDGEEINIHTDEIENHIKNNLIIN